MVGKSVSHFRILEELGRGGMGIVYRAEDTVLERIVAVKLLLPHALSSVDDRSRFFREARAAAALTHPNIAIIYSIEEATPEGSPENSTPIPLIAMEYVEGETLSERLEQTVMPIDEAVRISIQIAEGLKAAHTKHIIHRDIKSGNVMLCPDGRAKILDFGLAQMEGATRITQANSMLGTIAYMSPEQAHNSEVDHRSDLWSLGVVIYEMIAGRLPFEGSISQAVIYSIITMQPDLLSLHRRGVPDDLEEIVRRLLMKSPADRYDSAEQLIEALESLERKRTGFARQAEVVREPDTASEQASSGPSVSSPVVAEEHAIRKLNPVYAWTVGIAVVATVLIFGYYLVVNGGTSRTANPDSGVYTRVAVLPFSVRGTAQYEYLGEGMVDLLSTKLNGAGTWRSVDPRKILSAGRSDELSSMDPSDALSFAQDLGATLLVLGNVLEVGDLIKIDATLYDVRSRSDPIRSGSAEGSATEIFTIVDRMASQLLVGEGGNASSRVTSIASTTTNSIEALKAYLDGEEAYRALDYPTAADGFRRATDIDSTFALAWYRMAVTSEWLLRARMAREASEKAVRYGDRLAEREKGLLAALLESRKGAIHEAVEQYRVHLSTYPEEVDAWFRLGELLFHDGPFSGLPVTDSKSAWERVLELEPDNVPAQVHLIRILTSEGKDADAIGLIDQALRSAPEGDRNAELLMIRAIASGTESDIAEALAELERVDDNMAAEVTWFITTFLNRGIDIDYFWQKVLDPGRGRPLRSLGLAWKAYFSLSRGKLQSAENDLSALDRIDPVEALLQDALVSLLPFLPTYLDKLRTIRSELFEWDAASVAASSDPSSFFSVHNGLHPTIRLYLLGWISVRLGELEEAESYALQIEQVPFNPEIEFPIADHLSASIRAKISVAENKPLQALRYFEDARIEAWYQYKIPSPFYSAAHDRYTMATILERLGQNDEALRLFSSFDQGSPYDQMYRAPGLLRKAIIYLGQGENEMAGKALDECLSLWTDPDDVFSPLVQHALALRSELVAPDDL